MALTKGCACTIGPSILSADLSDLATECQRMMTSGSDYLHLDVMDGHFVPNLTFGHPVVKCLRPKMPNVFFEMHMMVQNPIKWVEDMHNAGADMYTFHHEATDDPIACIRKIKDSGMKVGLGINPGTDVSVVLPYVDMVDLILIMTVNPGFGGQSFIADCLPKVKFLREKYKDLDIEVDGGVGPKTIQQCADVGANVIVSGSALVKHDNPKEAIDYMRAIVNEAIGKSHLKR
ncbi:hypothetical protein ACOMHN_037879 [Nucella lapillus]